MTKLKDYRKFIAATASVAVIASTAATLAPSHALNVKADSFKDIKQGTYYYDAVVNLAQKGVITGFEDGTFKPNQAVTRGQAATMIARSLDLDGKGVVYPGFTDVNRDSYYYHSIAALVDAGIVGGVTEDSFQPDRPVTRAEMSKMIANAFGLKQKQTSPSIFKDVPGDSWYSEFVKALFDSGVTVGRTATTFAPNENVDRSQMATFIYRAQQNQSDNGASPTPKPTPTPTPIPGGGAGGGGGAKEDTQAPYLEEASLIIGGQEVAAIKQGDVWTISLAGLADNDRFTAVTLDSSEPGTASIKINGKSSGNQSLDNDGIGVIPIGDVLSSVVGIEQNSVSVSTLKTLVGTFGANLTGTIADTSNNSTTIKLNIITE